MSFLSDVLFQPHFAMQTMKIPVVRKTVLRRRIVIIVVVSELEMHCDHINREFSIDVLEL